MPFTIKDKNDNPIRITRIELIELKADSRIEIAFESKRLTIKDVPYIETIDLPSHCVAYDPREIKKDQWAARSERPYKRYSYNKDLLTVAEMVSCLDEEEGRSDGKIRSNKRIVLWQVHHNLNYFECIDLNLDIYDKILEIMKPYLPEPTYPIQKKIPTNPEGLDSITYTPAYSAFCYSPENYWYYSITLTPKGITYRRIPVASDDKEPATVYSIEYRDLTQEFWDHGFDLYTLDGLVGQLDFKKQPSVLVTDVIPATLSFVYNGQEVSMKLDPIENEAIEKIVSILKSYIPKEEKEKYDHQFDEEC